MKIFIGGARKLTDLDQPVQERLYSIYQHEYDVLVGDCYGIDTSVQRFYAGLKYDRVTVFTSIGKARNNVGNWTVRYVDGANLKGFELQRQKDIAMADEADYGFMIWDGMSKGTLSNIITLTALEKTTLVYLASKQAMTVIKDFAQLEKLLTVCPQETVALYNSIIRKNVNSVSDQTTFF